MVNQSIYLITVVLKTTFKWFQRSLTEAYNIVERKVRPKKVILFPEIGLVKFFLSPTRPHKSNVYNTYFLFQENTQTKKNSTSKFIRTNLHFVLQTMKDRVFCFSTKNSAVRVVFKCQIALKNLIKLIKKKVFCGHPGENFYRQSQFRKQEY